MAWVAMAAMAAGELAKGAAEQRAANSEAFQLRQRAGTARAQSQKAAIEETRQADLVMSRARAVAGASGAAVDDVGMSQTLGDIAAEGEYRSMVALWNGEESALGLEYAAKNRQAEGKAAMQGAALSAAGTAFSGYSGLKDKYSGGWKGPSSKKAGVYAPDGKKYWGALPGN